MYTNTNTNHADMNVRQLQQALQNVLIWKWTHGKMYSNSRLERWVHFCSKNGLAESATERYSRPKLNSKQLIARWSILSQSIHGITKIVVLEYTVYGGSESYIRK